jgi:hypothetical protein
VQALFPAIKKMGERATCRRRVDRLLIAAVAVAVVGGAAAAGSRPVMASAFGRSDSGRLTFKADLTGAYPPTACPVGTPSSVECFARTGTGVIRGLGTVRESYAYFVQDLPSGCELGYVQVLPTTVRLAVAGKGEIEIRLGGTGCLERLPPLPLRGDEALTVTGGSGKYAGASGGGTLSHLSYGPNAYSAVDTWAGTLVVAGVSFDLTPPAFSGATDRVVRAAKHAQRRRVSFNVTARDDIDGAVPVSCRPKPRSYFTLGRTTVRCSTTDSRANTATTRFVVTVKRR